MHFDLPIDATHGSRKGVPAIVSKSFTTSNQLYAMPEPAQVAATYLDTRHRGIQGKRIPMIKTLAVLLLSTAAFAAPAGAAPMTIEAINQAQWTPTQESGPSAALVKAQVLLDRAGFSPRRDRRQPGREFLQCADGVPAVIGA